MKKIGILTDNENLYNKIRLLLSRDHTAQRLTSDADLSEYCLIITDDANYEPRDSRCIILGADIPLPFRHEELTDMVEARTKDTGSALAFDGDGRHITLDGERIKLTDAEYRLLSVLYRAEADFVTRDELLMAVWGEGFDSGVVNVYIHYLRQKLEKNGRKMILSSRKFGYGIDKSYRGNGKC